MEKDKKAIIIGAGPAGLTAAYELLHKTNIQPVVFEADDIVGGIARTVNYRGNRIDIGGHRFFSKSDRVMKWWSNILPLQGKSSDENSIINIHHENSGKPEILPLNGADPEKTDKVMLIRNRLSRIFFLRKTSQKYYPIDR